MSDRPLATTADHVLVISLNRPQFRNALSMQLLQGLVDILAEHRSNTEIKSVILTGSSGCFSGGADLAYIQGTAADIAIDEAVEAVVEAIKYFPVPVIAAVEGACMGAAVDLALSCDLCVVDATAFFEVPATRLSLLYNPKSLLQKSLALSPSMCTRLFVIGERFSATQAVNAGIASHLVEAGEAVTQARALAARASLNSRAAMAATKAFFQAVATPEFSLDHWNALRMEFLSSPERQQAVLSAKSRLGLS